MIQAQQMLASLGDVDPFAAPIPGESLTSDPDNKLPFEQPPQFVTVEDAVQALFERIVTNEESLDQLLDLMRAEVPLEGLVEAAAFAGFKEGMYNPDVALLIKEPLLYIFIMLAELSGIHPVITPAGEEDDDEMDVAEIKELLEEVGINFDDDVFELEDLPEEFTLPSGETLKRPSLLGTPADKERAAATPTATPSLLQPQAQGEV